MKTALDEAALTEPCLSCQLDSAHTGRPCENARQDCETNAACVAVVTCVGTCDESAVTDTDCLGQCMYPVDKDEGTQLYNDWVMCTCSHCVAECNSRGDLVCDPALVGGGGPGGAGGAGGAAGGGVGGQGGQGGG